jgi:taurine dioxygenase
MKIDNLTPALGAEISGLDLSAPLIDETAERIYQVLLDRLVIMFRGQNMSPDAQVHFARAFGTLDEPHHVYPQVPGRPEIVMLRNDASHPPDTDDWHTDLTFRVDPPFASVLYAREVPRTGGDTLWSSQYAAYDGLPEQMKAQLAGLEAVHDMGSFRNDYVADSGDPTLLNEAMASVGSAVHPVVRAHPVTGRRHLYVNSSFTRHIIGMSTRESDRLLGYLYDHMDRPEYQVRFRWSDGTLAMWDNRVTQHYAVADYLPHARLMHRVTVIDDRRAGGERPA